ncbi:hypothetical protein ACFS5J_06590 [Flavobacterium chuncheonense]|uniref:HTH luxR-type domain-containing protein n=1 Tax=Flavobacterium chuncheonense TaxID=2026653 RepID=A0ABW5YKW4_9FLAO
MFLSHLIFILSAIGFILFAIRSNRQESFEKYLTFFSFLYFTATGTFLYLSYYSGTTSKFLDLYGVLNESITLLVPVVIVGLFGKKLSFSKTILVFLGVILTGILFTVTHFLIANLDGNDLIFYPSNTRLYYNVFLQLGYNVVLFVLFLSLLKRINFNETSELFDGVYKRVFSVLFIVYYIQDSLFFVGMLFSAKGETLSKGLYYFMLISNLLMAILLIALAVYTNWLFVLNKIKMSWQKISEEERNIEPKVFSFDIKNGLKDVKSWNDFKQVYADEFKEIIVEVEKLDFLSKTEKLYAALQPFDLSHKDIATLLSVSLRTVGTNFYRLRLKLKDNNFSSDFPYNLS